MKGTLAVYLAGPISNCNERQKHAWRDEIKTALQQPAGAYVCLDPTDSEWTPQKELQEIDRADVVIANMWRESIGTSLGIFHARYTGKPVILIDPNYLNNKILDRLVDGDRWTVRGVREAVRKLNKHTVSLRNPIQIEKRNGKGKEALSVAKLTRSVEKACLAANVSGDWHVWLASRVLAELRERLKRGAVTSDHVQEAVFAALDGITRERNDEAVAHDAAEIKQAWQRHVIKKADGRTAEELYRIADKERGELRAAFDEVRDENDDLRQKNERLQKWANDLQQTNVTLRRKPAVAPGLPAAAPSIDEQIRSQLAGSRVLCVRSTKAGSIVAALRSRGVSDALLDEAFVEETTIKGHHSNFNKRLSQAVQGYDYLISHFGGESIKHIDTAKKHVKRWFNGGNAHEAVEAFLNWALDRAAPALASAAAGRSADGD